jgi:spermidine synthase
VLERESAIISWGRGLLRGLHGDALADPRVRCVHADLIEWLGATEARFGAICLDIDNGPEWTVTEGNAALYTESGLELLAARLAPGGVVAVWSAAASEAFADRLRHRFGTVEVLTVPVPRGEPDVVFVAGLPAGPAGTGPTNAR